MNHLRMVGVAALVYLTGCIRPPSIQSYGTIDQSQKSVTVPPGSNGLKGKLKQFLVAEGWRLSIDKGPSVVEGDLGSKTKLESYDTFNTRYRLHVVSRQYDTCIPRGGPAITFDISFIDNKAGSEVFTLSGESCEDMVVEKFKEAITGVSPKAPPIPATE
jgi:hypothetical protein